MKPKSSLKKSAKAPAEQVVKDIRRQTRHHFSAEDKIRIVLEGLRGDDSIAELATDILVIRGGAKRQALAFGDLRHSTSNRLCAAVPRDGGRCSEACQSELLRSQTKGAVHGQDYSHRSR